MQLQACICSYLAANRANYENQDQFVQTKNQDSRRNIEVEMWIIEFGARDLIHNHATMAIGVSILCPINFFFFAWYNYPQHPPCSFFLFFFIPSHHPLFPTATSVFAERTPTLTPKHSFFYSNRVKNMHTARLLQQASRGMKPPKDVVPLLTFVSGGLTFGLFTAAHKLRTDPSLRHHVSHTIE
jgi:hypothetical protein